MSQMNKVNMKNCLLTLSTEKEIMNNVAQESCTVVIIYIFARPNLTSHFVM
jgi:hypothetical protein